MPAKYETVSERDGVKFEIVSTGQVSLFGEPIIQACTLREVLRPTMERRVLGTYNTHAAAQRRIDEELAG